MQITTLPLRGAVIEAIEPIVYQGKNIYAFDEYVLETSTRKKTVYPKFTAYIIILNQTSNNRELNKCVRNNQDTIQIQVTTVWPENTGNSRAAEEIADLVLKKLYPATNKNTSLQLPGGLHVWKSNVETVRNINYDSETSRTFITQLVIECQISQ